MEYVCLSWPSIAWHAKTWCNDMLHNSELPLIWTPEMWPPCIQATLKSPKIGFTIQIQYNPPPLKWGHPSNQDTLIGPKGGRIRGSSLYYYYYHWYCLSCVFLMQEFCDRETAASSHQNLQSILHISQAASGQQATDSLSSARSGRHNCQVSQDTNLDSSKEDWYLSLLLSFLLLFPAVTSKQNLSLWTPPNSMS